MNITGFVQTKIAAKTLAVFTIFSMILSAFPVAFFVAEAASPVFTDDFGVGADTATISGWEKHEDLTILREGQGSGEDIASPNGGRFAKIAEDSDDPAGKDGYICTSIDASDFTNLSLSYYWNGDFEAESGNSGGPDLGVVEARNNGEGDANCGAEGGWTTLGSHDLTQHNDTWNLESVDISAFDDTTFTIRFRNESTADDEWFRVDGIEVAGDEYVAPPKDTETIVVSADTSAGENQPGWMFNRDVANATPIEFNTDEKVIGNGALYVLPISNSDAARKFIGEYFWQGLIADLDGFSYDFKIGAGGAASDENEFYLNVYANFGGTSVTNYYDCKYDVVPTVGSTGSFTTVTFDPSSTYTVTTRGSSPFTCPTSPADMDTLSTGSTIRAFAINTGDTTLTDADLDGYFDNVVLETQTKVTTFDFEPIEVPDCELTDTVALTTFDTFNLGNVNGQNGWNSTGPFDQEIVTNVYGFESFGCQSLRLSNAVTSGSFGDQTFAAPLTDSVGEVDATAAAFPEGTRYNHYEAEFDIASTKPGEEQVGLAISVSPDRGDGSRMSYLSFADTATGIDVTFYDTQGTTNPANFTPTNLGTLDSTVPHTIKFEIDTNDGPDNDVVKIYIDGTLVHTGGTWENYYRFDAEASAEQTPRLLKTILFRASGNAVPANDGEGFLIDNLSLDAKNNVADTIKPDVTVKDGAVICEGGYSLVSFKLHDAGKVDKIILNGVEKNLSNNVWSDLNNVEPGKFGAVEGINVLEVYDVAGNVTEFIFTLCDDPSSAPTATVKDGDEFTTTCEDGYKTVSYKLYDADNIDRVVINGVEKNLSNNPWSDVNFLAPGVFGAVEGENTMVVYDEFGNNSTYTFFLCPEKELLVCEIVSDTDTVVLESDSYAVETYVHPAWTASIPGATWVWETFFVENPANTSTKTFGETFEIDGLSSAELTVAADNSYKITINDTEVVNNTDENNFSNGNEDVYDVTSYLIEGTNTFEMEVTNFAQNNGTSKSNPAGALYKLSIEVVNSCEITTETSPYVAHCGDGYVNQEWEMCEPGDEGCTDYCTWDNQCTDLQLVKVTLDDTQSVSFDGTLNIGAAGVMVPNGTWFNFAESGDDDYVSIANTLGDDGGLAIERDVVNGELALAFRGGNARTHIDIVSGAIETKGILFGDVERKPNPTYKLENLGEGFEDIFDVDNTDKSIDFDLRADTGHDGVTVQVTNGGEFDCPECKATVEARVIVNDSGYAGAGSEIENIILGDSGYSTVEFGEWFPISLAANPGDSAVMINDPNTVTGFAGASSKNGLFVSREDGTVKVALYGEFSTGKTDNEWIDARIEIRDAEITNFVKMSGAFKFENHPENDSVDSNDGFDEATADVSGVDFKMWVDTGSDGFKFDIDSETIAFCENDSVDDTTMLIEGYKYEGTGEGAVPVAGWEIELYEEGEGPFVASTTTDEFGYYSFEVPQGDYDVYEVMQYGWYQVGVSKNGEALDEFEFQTSCEFDYNPQIEDQEFRCDFYNEQEKSSLNYIDGYKYELIEGSESLPVVGWTIFASNGFDTPLSTTTDASGYYYFEVPAGEWEVYEASVEGWTQVEVQQYDYIMITEAEPLSCEFKFSDEQFYLISQALFIQDSEEFEFIGNRCSFFNEQDEEEIETFTRSSRSSGTRVTNQATPAPLVAGASTSFCPFINDYMQIGIANDSWEVTKLQLFLNIFVGPTPITGIFDSTTDANVKLFQEKYRSEVLDPWVTQGIVPSSEPTGFVYKLTRWKINDLVCPGSEEYPSFEGEDLTTNVDLD